MKRVVRPTKVAIEIVAILAETEAGVAVGTNVEINHRDLPISQQLSKAQFEAYKNFVKSVVSIVHNFGFDVVDEYQSNLSYSYYIQFTPNPYSGFEDQMLELDVKFRLSDHYSQSTSVTEELAETKKSGVIFQSFVVEGVKHDDIVSTLLDIRNICKDLKMGDYSRLQ